MKAVVALSTIPPRSSQQQALSLSKTSNCSCCGDDGCGKKAIGLQGQLSREGLAIPSISTGFTGVVGFILCEKASTVRQR
jgi:hypothetical protein